MAPSAESTAEAPAQSVALLAETETVGVVLTVKVTDLTLEQPKLFIPLTEYTDVLSGEINNVGVNALNGDHV